MPSQRKGRAFKTIDGDIKHYLEVVPIMPRGWIIRKDGELAYGGLVFNEASALQQMMNIKQRLETLQGLAKWNPNFRPTSFEEAKSIDLLPIQPPKGTHLDMIASCEGTEQLQLKAAPPVLGPNLPTTPVKDNKKQAEKGPKRVLRPKAKA